MWHFDKRVWSHQSRLEYRWIDIIPFDEEHYFLAPALEFFLICKLNPLDNRVFRGYATGVDNAPQPTATVDSPGAE